jgi:hypothetical protein
MANQYFVNPIRLDTVMASSWKTQIATVLGTFYDLRVEKVLWETPVTVGDHAIFTDPQNGNVLVTLACDTANVSQCLDWSAKPKRWQDFILSHIDSGIVWLYVV